MKKASIIISIVLFILFAGVEIYVQSDDFGRKIRPSVLGPLKDLLGADAEIGRVTANFIPPYLEVRDISIRGDDGKEAVAIRRVRAYINPLPLLQKKIRLPSISILEPRIFAERGKDGAINIAQLIDRIKTNALRKESEVASGYSLLLRNLSLRKGRIEFKDGLTSVQLFVTDINMTAGVELSQERFTTSIKSSRIRVATPAYPEISGALKASAVFDRGRIHLDALEFSTADATLNLSGEAGYSPDAALDLKVRIGSGPQVIGKYFDFLKPVRKRESSRFEVQALIRGNRAAPLIEGSLKLSALPFREYLLQEGSLSFAYRERNLIVTGRQWKLTRGDANLVIDSIDAALGYSGGGLDIGRLDVAAGDLELQCTGRADPATGFNVLLTAGSSGKGRTLSFLTSVPIDGAVTVTGRLIGALASPRFNGRLFAGPVTVRSVQFSDVAGAIEYEEKKLLLTSVDITEQRSRYVFDGNADLNGKEPVYSARLRVLRSDVVNIVALFYDRLPLKLSASGELTFQGTAQKYSGSGFLKLDAGSAYGESFVRGAITASLTTGKIAFPQVVLHKEQGVVTATGWIGFDGTYSADLESRGIVLSAVDWLGKQPFGGESKLDIHSSGTFSRPLVMASFDVDALTLHDVPVGGVHAEAVIREGALTFKAGLTGDRADLAMHWKLQKPYPWTAEVKVRSEGIDPFLALGSKGFADRVKVLATGAVKLRGQGFAVASVSGEGTFPRLGLAIGDYRIENESDARFSVEGGKLSVKEMNFIGSGTRITAAGWAGFKADMDITLKGTANLSLLKLLYREVEHAAGFSEIKLEMKGDWEKPDVAGELVLRNGELKIKDIPQRFTALNSKIIFSQGRFVTDSLSGEMGGGTLRASGWAQLSGTALQEFSAKASVENMTVRYPEGLSSTLSGELYYDGDASEQSLTGDITISRARYDKRVEWKSMLVDIGRGLYQKSKTEVGWIGDTLINVRFHGSNSILFQNNLATMPLDVDVFLQGTVNHPQFLGRIEARKGMVYFRKNEFKILHASADFVDPSRMNPVLDIEAETQVREYLIRLAITGTAERAVVVYISEPSLSDTDILSLLALGKLGSELKGKETGVGMGEAASFATGQFQDIFEQRARSLTGFDRFQVDPYVGKSDTSVPRVTVGKELMQNELYVTFSSNVGAAAPEQMFRIEYLLDRHFSLLGERDELGNLGTDIKYRFEFK